MPRCACYGPGSRHPPGKSLSQDKFNKYWAKIEKCNKKSGVFAKSDCHRAVGKSFGCCKKGGVIKRKSKAKAQKDWIQKADIKEGAFTRKARQAGYKDTLKYARKIKKEMKAKPKPLSKADLRLQRQATFALNANA